MSELSTYITEARVAARIASRYPRFRPGAAWNPARCLSECARRWPDNVAILFEDRRYAWREVDRIVDRTARAFQEIGVQPGDSVAVLMDNRPEYLFAVCALSRLRAKAALLNTNVTGASLIHAIKAGRASYALVGAEHEGKISAIRDELPIPAELVYIQRDGELECSGELTSFDTLVCRAADGPLAETLAPTAEEHACYIYTSGTTGLPKAAVIPNSRFMMGGTLFGRGLLDLGPGDVIYVTLPLYHSNGMIGGWSSALQGGATIALRRKFSASNFWSDIRKFEATAFMYIGELLRYLLNAPEHPRDGHHKLRAIAGNGLRPDIWEEFQTRFNVPLIREIYGATEGTTVLANCTGRVGMVGRLQPGLVVARCDLLSGDLWRGDDGHSEAVEPGEVGLLITPINSLTKFDGYVDEEASQKKILTDVFVAGDRYFNTGDLLKLHEGRWLSFADRVGDTFRWKGENVSTNEVAETLNGATGVLESNVYGVEVPGTEGRAGMASVNHDEAFELDLFNRWVIDNLPVYQRPYFLRLQSEMRITGTFKHQKVDYRKEGYDPSQISDPLFFLDGEKYVPLSRELHERIAAGEVKLR
jgi:acyl-CoA synthetase (AMP-forming)/AMP-acid ligase II